MWESSTETLARTNTRGEKPSQRHSKQAIPYWKKKQSEQFPIKKNLFQMHSEANVARLLLQEKQTAKTLAKKKNNGEEEEEEKEKQNQKKKAKERKM